MRETRDYRINDNDLTTSDIHIRNVLNNKFALQEIEKEIAIPGISFESVLKYTKRQVAISLI